MTVSKVILKTGIIAVVATVLIGLSSVGTTAYAWRSTSSRSVNGNTLYARENLPYFSDWQGGGNWQANAQYKGSKNSNQLSIYIDFYSVGGSVSASGVGFSGSGSSRGAGYTVRGSSTTASGRVYGNGLTIYLGMNTTASFRRGNSYYSTTAHI